MALFDFQSLFINIPLDETIEICLELLFYKKRKVKRMLKKHVKGLLTYAVKSLTFMFNDDYYKKVDGVAMESPLGPTLANLFSMYYEIKWFEDCPQQFKPQFYHRYVEDIFIMFKKKDHIKKFPRYINSCHRNIKFTREEEKDSKMSFLDISISGNNNALENLSFINLYLVVSTLISIVSYQHQQNVKEVCCTRCYTEHPTFVPAICRFMKKLINLKSVWQKTSFPLFLVDNCIHKFLNKLFIKRVRDSTTTQRKK